MKQLSKQAILELEIEQKFSGMVWCYVPVLNSQSGYALGIAVANEAGYSPISPFWANAESYDAMSEEADRLNAERGLSEMEAIRIACSSMFKRG